ncbi:DUF397 domain-containing protein [Streptomyces nondiastaticus]|uniref:DUF397 domain-containing protein n=1 Tax=Streptomyces nondiastaticus TaxID=3154512 RepID=UPI0034127CBE
MSDRPKWFKSSYSGDHEDLNCVEVAGSSCGVIRVRDSKLGRMGARLSIPGRAWETFITYASEAAVG